MDCSGVGVWASVSATNQAPSVLASSRGLAERLPTYTTTLLVAAVSVIGVTVTLMALIPLLIELVQNRQQGFFATRDLKKDVRKALHGLVAVTWIEIAAILLTVANAYLGSGLLLLANVFLWIVGLVVLVQVSTQVALALAASVEDTGRA